MHFGIARAHSQAAPPKSVNTAPVDHENGLVITRMANPALGNWTRGNQISGEAHNCMSCVAQWLSTMQAMGFEPGGD